MNARRCWIALVLVGTASTPAADLITGLVTDSLGNPVAGVDIDARDLVSGDDVTLANDGTDASGMFATTIPAGLYRLTFTPPPPPTTTHLVMDLDDVVVVGTTNLGTVALPAGVSVGGTLLDAGANPVLNVNIDVVELSSGDDLDLIGDTTNALGQFLVAVPATSIELQLKTNNVVGPLLAPQAFQLDLVGNTSIGTVTLLPGFTVTGHVQTSGGASIQGADTDMFDTATGDKAFTPNDNTNALGNFSVVVPAGTWDLEICPPNGPALVGEVSPAIPIASNTALGIFALANGVTLSGTVRDPGGALLPGADVDVDLASTGASLVLCGDNTNASGNYSVFVPNGTYDVVFEAPGGIDFQNNVVVSGNTVLDSMLTACVSGSFAFRNAGANPASLTTDRPTLGNSFTVTVDLTTTGHAFALPIGFSTPFTLPLGGGQTLLTNVLDPNGELLGLTAAAGPSAVFELPVPPSTLFCGLTVSMQAIHFGGVAPFALSNAQDLVVGTSF